MAIGKHIRLWKKKENKEKNFFFLQKMCCIWICFLYLDASAFNGHFEQIRNEALENTWLCVALTVMKSLLQMLFIAFCSHFQPNRELAERENVRLDASNWKTIGYSLRKIKCIYIYICIFFMNRESSGNGIQWN